MDVQADGKSEDAAWAICNSQISEVATALGIAGVGLQEEVPIDIAKALPDPEKMSSHVEDATHTTREEVPIDIAKVLPDPDKMRSHPEDATTSHDTKESHNPLDIPFGYEVNEINKGVKDVPGPDEVDEGGLGSGRNPEGGGQGGGQPGPLISFGETLFKEMVDSKLSSCQCNKKNQLPKFYR